MPALTLFIYVCFYYFSTIRKDKLFIYLINFINYTNIIKIYYLPVIAKKVKPKNCLI